MLSEAAKLIEKYIEEETYHSIIKRVINREFNRSYEFEIIEYDFDLEIIGDYPLYVDYDLKMIRNVDGKIVYKNK